MTLLHDIIKRSRRLAETSKRSYLSDINRWVGYAGENPKNWTRYRAQEFYDQLITVDKLMPQSATRIVMSLRYAAAMWAELESKPELDFTTAIEFAKNRPTKHRSALTVERAKTLLLSCGSGVHDTGERARTPVELRDFALIVVALETGMRKMSLVGMQIETTGKVVAQGYPTTLVPLKGHEKDRFPIPLSDTAQLALEPWLQWLAGQKIKTGAVFRTLVYSVVERKLVISDTISEKGLYNVIVNRAKAAEIGHVHPHLFRHTFVTWRTLAGVPPEQIAAITLHRHEGDKLGELYTYMDKRGEIAEKARSHTPAWLVELVQEVTKR